MAAITTRQTAGTGATVAGVPLTNAQLDTNFINLNTSKAETASPTFTATSGAPAIIVNGGTINSVTYTTSEARIADGSLHLMKTSAGGVFEALRAINNDVTAGTTVRLLAAATSDPFNNGNGGKVFVDAVRTASNMDLVFSLNDNAGTAPTERLRLLGSGALAFNGSTSYGTSGQVLQSNGNAAPTWVSLSPVTAGSNTQVQYNSSGALAGSANMTFDGTKLTLNSLTVTNGSTIQGLTVGRGANAVGNNVALGVAPLNSANLSGAYNIAIGAYPLFNNSSGTNSVAIGTQALATNTTGYRNTAVGDTALTTNLVGAYNTALGNAALNLSTGNDNLGLGHSAGSALTTGSNNTIIGSVAGTAGLSDTVIIAAGSAERMRIDSLGNVGLNTSAPAGLLTVAQSTIGPGSISNVLNGTTITGTGTTFTTTFALGDQIVADGGLSSGYITAIASDTSLTVSSSFGSAHTNATYGVPGGTRFNIKPRGSVIIGGAVNIGSQTDPIGLITISQSTTGPGVVNNDIFGTIVTGVGTTFTSTFKVGDTITVGTVSPVTRTISAIASDTSLTLSSNISSANTNSVYTLVGGTRFQVNGNGNTKVAGQIESTVTGFKFPDGTVQATAATGANWTKITANTTATTKKQYVTDTTAGAFIVTLPATAVAGDYVYFMDAGNWATNNLTIARNGKTIEASDTDLVLDVAGLMIQLIFDGTTWQVTTNIGTPGPTGATGPAPTLVIVSATTQTAVAGNHYVLTNVAATTITMPADPVAGAMIWVTSGNGLATNVIVRSTIAGVLTSSRIMGLVEDLTINTTAYTTMQLRYLNPTIGWAIL